MDEQQLSELFRAAAGKPPPASFDRDDVLAASRRAAARRRSALAGGSLLGIAVLTGGVMLGGQVLQPGTDEAAPPAASTAPPPQPGGRMLEQPPASLLGAPPGAGPDISEGAGSCGPADPALAAELTEALAGRGAEPAGPTVPLSESCPPGSRAAGLPVPGGTIYLVLTPPTPGATDTGTARADGSRGYATTTARGQLLAVLSVPAAPTQPAPLAQQLEELARELARQL